MQHSHAAGSKGRREPLWVRKKRESIVKSGEKRKTLLKALAFRAEKEYNETFRDAARANRKERKREVMNKITPEELLQLADDKKFLVIKERLSEENPIDIAGLFGEIPPERVAPFFRLLPKELAADTFVEMDSDMQEKLITGFSDYELHALVDELYVDDTVDIIEEMPANVVKRILASADPSMRSDINEILKYPGNSAGSIMTTEYVTLKPTMTASEAFDRIRQVGSDSETIYTCYVTSKDKKLVGVGGYAAYPTESVIRGWVKDTGKWKPALVTSTEATLVGVGVVHNTDPKTRDEYPIMVVVMTY